MFPRGAVELVDHFMHMSNQRLKDELPERLVRSPGNVPKEDSVGMDESIASAITENIKTGVRVRLEFIHPYIKTWPQAMADGLVGYEWVMARDPWATAHAP